MGPTQAFENAGPLQRIYFRKFVCPFKVFFNALLYPTVRTSLPSPGSHNTPYPDQSNTSKITQVDMNEVRAESCEAIETMIGPLQEFRFERLSSTTCIRLIKIHTELVRGDISCTLQQYESDSSARPAYVALSYVWGDPTATHTVCINGMVCRVHHSLWQFLNRTRMNEAMACEWFWTDLLCIDQIHHSEKNEQVSRMGDIYSEAKYVISWLGERTSTMDALRTFIQFSKKDGTHSPVKYAWKTPESHQIHKACDQLAFEEPYWERVWIMQEVACAKECIVACGDISLNFDDLLQNMETTMDRSTRFDDPSDRDRRMQRIRGLANIRTRIVDGRSMSTLDLINRTSFCQATRDQDRIYGLLGLARRLDPGFDHRALGISYDKSLSEIWWDVIFMVIDEKSEIGTSDMKPLETTVPTLPPPRKQLGPDGITSSRTTQVEIACQASEAAYSITFQKFLCIPVSDMDKLTREAVFQKWFSRREAVSEERRRDEWEKAMLHIYDHENDFTRVQKRLGRFALAGLQFTSWHHKAEWQLVSVSNCLPEGWFCAAHLPHHWRDITSKHRMIPLTGFSKINTGINWDALQCYGADSDAGECDFSCVALRLEQLGMTCLVRQRRVFRLFEDETDIEFYCDCCGPTDPCDISDP